MSNNMIDNVIHQISFHPKDRRDIFLSQAPKQQAVILVRLTKRVQRDLVSKLSFDELLAAIEHLDPDEVTDIIQLLPKHKQHKILTRLSETLRQHVELLSQFDPQTAAGLMRLDYILVEETDTVINVA